MTVSTSPTEKGAGWVSGAEGHCSWSAVSKQKGRRWGSGERDDPTCRAGGPRGGASWSPPSQRQQFSKSTEFLTNPYFLGGTGEFTVRSLSQYSITNSLSTFSHRSATSNTDQHFQRTWFPSHPFCQRYICPSHICEINVVSFPVHLMCSSLKL